MNRTPRRSVSPFGTAPELASDPFAEVSTLIASAFGPAEGKAPRKLSSAVGLPYVATFLRKSFDATANDAPWLSEFCRFLVDHKPSLEENKVGEAVYAAMERIFDRKTELFLVDHHVVTEQEYEAAQEAAAAGKPAPRALVAGETHDNVLFSRERDTLVGGFFAPWTERAPGEFSAFIHRWAESENPDRVLHFLDFCAGSKNPTFEYYLLFTHPALARWSNKSHLKGLFDRVAPLLPKIKSPTWEPSVRALLGL